MYGGWWHDVIGDHPWVGRLGGHLSGNQGAWRAKMVQKTLPYCCASSVALVLGILVASEFFESEAFHFWYLLVFNIVWISTYNAFRPTPRPRRNWSRMMLPSLHTQNKLYSESHPTSQTLPSSLASRSASIRQVLHQPVPQEENNMPDVTIDETDLRSVRGNSPAWGPHYLI